MLESILSNANAERVLLYIASYGEGHAAGIAQTFGVPLFGVQRQLARLERGGVLASHLAGRTRLYRINPRYPLRRELSALLNKALQFVPDAERKRYFRQRRRPVQPGGR